MKDYSELKMLAEAATPGRWTAYDTHGKRFIEAIGTEDHVVCATPKKQWLKDSKYIASADPVTVLELIAEIESMKKDAARYRWLRKNNIYAHVQVIQKDGSELYVYDSELDRSVDWAIYATKDHK